MDSYVPALKYREPLRDLRHAERDWERIETERQKEREIENEKQREREYRDRIRDMPLRDQSYRENKRDDIRDHRGNSEGISNAFVRDNQDFREDRNTKPDNLENHRRNDRRGDNFHSNNRNKSPQKQDTINIRPMNVN